MAVVDVLAESLSKQTGTKFIILRRKLPEGQRYALKATRDGHSYTFQCHRPMKLNEMTRWLASICDAIDMGFIPVQRNI